MVPNLRSAPSTGPESRDEERPKSVLFCPDCGHESPVRGDWLLDVDCDRERFSLVCPECSYSIANRCL